MNLPEGWPTKEMVLAASNTPHGGYASPLMYWKQVVINVLAAAPTPQAQEDAPVVQVESVRGDLAIARFRGMHEVKPGDSLYIRPQDDRLRKAAEEVIKCIDRDMTVYAGNKFIEQLRDALEKK